MDSSPASRPTSPDKHEDSAHPLRRRVLIVDDDSRNIEALKGMLLSEPYDLIVARSGAEALRIIDHEPPDLVLLDIMMPAMNGFEVCKYIKGNPRLRIIPVVVVTALNDVSDRIEAMRAGADDFLSKPIDDMELIVRVRSLMRMRQLYTEIERVTAQRLQFMAGIAHNLRSPLNALTLSVEMLADQLPADAALEPIWQNIKASLENIQMLTNDILHYYQIEAGQFQIQFAECSLPDLIASACAIAMPLAKGVHFRVDPIPPMKLTADSKVIVQVLLNLITNAFKYTPPGGEVRLHTYDLAAGEYALPDYHYPPLLTLPNTGVVIEIVDSGQGIQPEDYERVFIEFDRIHAQGGSEGIGLGLPISQRLVRLHGGEIWFASSVGQGSTFAFFLPIRPH